MLRELYTWIKFHSEVLSILISLAGAVATALAVVVALFLEPFRQWFRRPILRISWRQRDCTMDASPVGSKAERHRILVFNEGREAAEGVDATIVDVFKRDDRSLRPKFDLLHGFLPTPLKWTHSQSSLRSFIPGKANRLLDLGSFSSTEDIFQFDTEIEPTNEYNKLRRGVYVARIVVAARNARAATINIRLGIGRGTEYDKFYSYTADSPPFSISVFSRTWEQFLESPDNLLDEERPTLAGDYSSRRRVDP